MSTKRIVRLNASALRHAACIRKLWFTVIDGYKAKRNSGSIEYGTAVHKIAQALDSGSDLPVAIAKGQMHLHKSEPIYSRQDKHLDEFHLTRTAMAFNIERSRSGTVFSDSELLKFPDGRPLVEQTFSIPIYSDENFDFLLEGTLDRLVKILRGCICYEDFKTTAASKDHRIYLKSFRLSHQLLTYVFALYQYILAFPDHSLSKAVAESNGKIGTRIIGVFVDPNEPTTFEASEVFFYTDKELHDFYIQLKNLCLKLIPFLSSNELPYAEGQFNSYCSAGYGSGCSFFDLCASLPQIGEPAMRQVALQRFKKEEYLPLREK